MSRVMPVSTSDWRAAYVALLDLARDGGDQWHGAARELGNSLRDSRIALQELVGHHFAVLGEREADAEAATAPARSGDSVLASVVRAYVDDVAVSGLSSSMRLRIAELFDEVPVGIYRTTRDGRFVGANSALVEMLGATDLRSLVAMSVTDFYAHPDERSKYVGHVERATSMRPLELEMRRSDGRPLWVSDHGHAVRDAHGRVLYFEGVLLDITERKRAEVELRERWMQLESLVVERTRELQHAKDRAEHELSERRRAEAATRAGEARFRQLFDQSPIATAIIGLDGRFERVNSAFCMLLGYREEELVGRTFSDFSYGDDALIGQEESTQVLAGEVDRGVVEKRYVRRDGHLIWVRVSARAILDAEGRPLHFVSLAQDVTGEKRAADLVRLQRDLGVALLRASELPEALSAVLDTALKIEDIDAGGVYIVAPGGELELVTNRGLSPRFVAAIGRLPPESPQGQFVRTGAPLYVSVGESPYTRELLASEGLKSLASVPVMHEGRAVACLNVASRMSPLLPRTTRDALEALASNAGSVIARLHDREALAASERLFRTLTNTIPALTVIIERDNVAYINRAGAQMLGYDQSEVIGKPLGQFIPAERRDALLRRTLDRQLGREVPGRYEVPVIQSDGNELWLDMSAARIEYQGRPASLGVALDVSERRRSEEALRLMQERLAMAIQAADLGVFDWNIVTGQVSYSDRWQTMLGYEPGELAAHYSTWENALHPDERERILRLLSEHLAGRTGEYVVEMRLRTKTGGWKWVLASGKVVQRDAQGAPLRMSGTHLDISARKEAEELARQHSEQLAHVSRVSTIGEMASALAHEMAQPLSAILYYARGASARLRQDGTPAREIGQVLDKIAAQAARAGEFIRQIKAFVRNARPSHVPSDINDAVRDAIVLAEPLVRQRSVDLQSSLASSLPRVVIDKIQIEQVILNLLQNAVEAMDALPRGDRRMNITSSLSADGALRVAVQNRGPGIPAHAIARVFEPFFTTKVGGTGLGLSISRSIIEAHDGTLRIQSSERDGTVVWFTLPPASE